MRPCPCLPFFIVTDLSNTLMLSNGGMDIARVVVVGEVGTGLIGGEVCICICKNDVVTRKTQMMCVSNIFGCNISTNQITIQGRGLQIYILVMKSHLHLPGWLEVPRWGGEYPAVMWRWRIRNCNCCFGYDHYGNGRERCDCNRCYIIREIIA